MTEQWEIDLYEKNLKDIIPECAKKGRILRNVGTPITTTYIDLHEYNGSVDQGQHIKMLGVGCEAGFFFYIDKSFDDVFDIKLVIPFRRGDTNNDDVSFLLRLSGYQCDGVDSGGAFNIENGTPILFEACPNDTRGKYVYILNNENYFVNDIISGYIALNEGDGRVIYVYNISMEYKKKGG